MNASCGVCRLPDPLPKLLFDENLASRLVRILADTYPASAHVTVVEGPGAADQAIWAYARANDSVIVTKDEDFVRLSVLHGFPPKVIWIGLGNCSTAEVAELLRAHATQITAFVRHEEAAFLALG